MQFIADLHIHSKYSRATSKNSDLKNLDQWAKIKGIDILATGDYTFPAWFNEIKTKLQPLDNGLFILKKPIAQPDKKLYFILSTEISCIYKKNDQCRRIHVLILFPDLKSVKKFNVKLDKIGNIKSDGRPILGLDAKVLAQIALEINDQALIIPAHIWTPWFSLFGSKSGFNSIEECFEDLTPYIFAAETGLSSDPAMNWQWSHLNRLSLVSNSDAHSPENLGREANVFNFDQPSYDNIYQTLKNKDKNKFLHTLEFYPQEGKYHYDGHRKCNVCFSPQETLKNKGICPVCKKPLTVGVSYRITELSDRQPGFKPTNSIPFKNLIPLKEIIAQVFNCGTKTKKVAQEYDNLIKHGQNEFNILLDLNEAQLKNITTPEITQGILNMRQGKVKIQEGYDGIYGIINVTDSINKIQQNNLF
ncbi:MAG: endonuclease Q family protein [Patescibacteria group bacterium]|nr:endonuclease Q family protein [Patescibacteria group bacterium]